MAIRYEANPPKVVPGTDMAEQLKAFVGRIARIAPKCDAIHITENVLGFERVSPIAAGRAVREVLPDLPVTVTMRVRDKDGRQVAGFAEECAEAGFAGILVLAGDPPRSGGKDSGMVPSKTVRTLKGQGFDSRLDLYLSCPNNPDMAAMGAKVDAGPKGFITQVIRDVGQVERLAGILGGFDVIPIALYPSERNAKSAEFLGLDMAKYGDFAGLVSGICGITGDVLLTSPNDFAGLDGFLARYAQP